MTPEDGLMRHLNAGLAMLNGQKPKRQENQVAMTPERLEDLRNGWQHNATTECIVEIDRLWGLEAAVEDDALLHMAIELADNITDAVTDYRGALRMRRDRVAALAAQEASAGSATDQSGPSDAAADNTARARLFARSVTHPDGSKTCTTEELKRRIG